ncbi:hypothetical protein ACCS78_29425, partial [Rhizobium johnstonii]
VYGERVRVRGSRRRELKESADLSAIRPGGTMPQGFFQFCRRLSQNLKKAGLCPDISIRASGESSATDLSVNLYG